MTEDEANDMAIRHLGKQAYLSTWAWLEAYYGSKCPEFDPDCVVCKKWWVFEELFDGLEDSDGQ